MASTSAVKKRPAARQVTRSGRPPREQAGEVEERILNAARDLFLDHGFEGASIDDIAGAARSGKPTIYARFPNKQAIFAAAITHHVMAKYSELADLVATGATLEERLTNIGIAILQRALNEEWIGLIRLAIGEARRFPDLSSLVVGIIRERGGETIARLLGEAAVAGEIQTLLEFGADQIATTAGYFRDLVVLPIIMRALSGEDLDGLRAEVEPHVRQRTVFFLGMCRHDGIR